MLTSEGKLTPPCQLLTAVNDAACAEGAASATSTPVQNTNKLRLRIIFNSARYWALSAGEKSVLQSTKPLGKRLHGIGPWKEATRFQPRDVPLRNSSTPSALASAALPAHGQ